MKSRLGRSWLPVMLACCLSNSSLLGQSADMAPPDSMLAVLEGMLAENPGRADTWRLLGRVQHQQHRVAEARGSYERALELQPDNVAAHSDLGDLLEQAGDRERAAYHREQVMRLAPSSDYARQLVARGLTVPLAPASTPAAMPQMAFDPIAIPNSVATPLDADANPGDATDSVDLAAYEIQTFDGADDLERGLQNWDAEPELPVKRVRGFFEFGSLYNTNVSLTPISRELTDVDAASYQGFFSPDLEWTAVSMGLWRTGPLLRGYFTVNEDAFQAFNLASFQPGAFVERDVVWWDQPMVGRAEYVYAVDLMDGDRFGDRHAVTASLMTMLECNDVIYSYFTTSFSQFTDDGADPTTDSLDGVAFTTGVSRFIQTEWVRIPTWSFGADLEWADTEGDNYRYEAVNFHTDATLPLTARLSLIPRVGIGYRRYGDFTGPISRDELTYRLGAKLRWKWSDAFSISAVVGHDRFASENEDFDSQRTEGGVVATVVY